MLDKFDLQLFGENEDRSVETVSEVIEDYGMNAQEALGTVTHAELTRIADSLESISDSLEALSECVGYVPPAPHQKEGYHILRIGGSVDTGNY